MGSETTIVTMLDPNWWTIGRMLIAFIVVVGGISMIRDAFK